ncbi:MAG: hypothetical protein DRG20_04305 [Deltaproteobacteria bacterium]|nr:MAG: hypothetical protein DRG20_04305 [Deltaproteobacteria bacterium]
MKIEKLYLDYLPLIKSIASKYRKEGVPFEDLIQEGFLGLLEAEKRFNTSRKVKFSTYAFYWIKKRILEAVRKEKIQSLNSLELKDEIIANPIIEKTYESKELDIFLDKNLSSLEQKIFKLYFQEGKSLSLIAKELNMCREKVRQIKYLLLRKIKINQKLTEDLYVVNRLSV